ncbi:hypothetical protein H6F74_03005 [Trichocoleus sp. FACHB-90]|uniref:hypothetical protein n=1 Tax=Cyanophyceae TaxID=3028117 RepID=UPI001689C279|nr:hypothetical protein [Trichocoleus sp. FACHB-90]MBD1925257.1 hypothetical protein [Trichocoleus sp. FACHB-90]
MGSSSVHKLLASLSPRFDCNRWYNFSAAAIASEPHCIFLSARVRFSLCPFMNSFTDTDLGFRRIETEFSVTAFSGTRFKRSR